MNACEPPTAGDGDEIVAPSTVCRPSSAAVSALLFASPHSGRIYPRHLLEAARIAPPIIRRSEDAYVDYLIAGAPDCGITTISARLARAYLDVNRGPWELDPRMFEDELPAQARTRTARVAAGLGVIPRTVGDDMDIYARKLTFAEAQARIAAVHHPYHAAVTALMADIRREHGLVILIDWHSMPARAARHAFGGGGCDMVLGDRFGASCSPAILRSIERHLQDLGYRVARNAPYAGGYTTEHYGRPEQRTHALQIEINRALYLDEDILALTTGFATLKTQLGRLFARLSGMDWASV